MMPHNDGGPVYRNPPYILGSTVFMANELEDKVDWGLKKHNIPEHWDSKGHGVIVGIADTGNPEHSDVDEAILEAHNFSTSFTVNDTNGHATHVAGTVGARLNDHGVVGVAPECALMIAKVLGDDGSGSSLGIARGIDWLASQGCHIINLSLGGGYDETIAKVVQEAVNAGIFVICAAGNEGEGNGRNTMGYPARLPSTVAVASYNKEGELSGFSSRGKEVHIAFPGEDILSTWLNNSYRRISGTSMATPFCSGLVALLLSTQGQPKIANNAQLVSLLRDSAVDKGPTGRDRGWGWGVVDVDRFFASHCGVTNGMSAEETPAAPGVSAYDIAVRLGSLNVKYPVTLDGERGAFISVPE